MRKLKLNGATRLRVAENPPKSLSIIWPAVMFAQRRIASVTGLKK